MLITAFTRFITLLFICVMCAAPAAFAQSFVIGTPLNNPVSGHTATTLSDGSVVVIGLQVEIYDPVTATWAVMAPMNVPRSGHSATLINGNTIMVAGGSEASSFGSINSVELYDITNNTWATISPMQTARIEHKATLLNTGKVLVVAGAASDPSFVSLDSAELFDPATNTWSSAGTLDSGRYRHGQVLLDNGEVLVAGGRNFTASSALTLATAEIYTPATNLWRDVPNMNETHSSGGMVKLSDGRVLMATGSRTRAPSQFSVEDHSGAEIYDPVDNSWANTGSLNKARRTSRATLMCDGKVLLTGGFDGSNFEAPVINSAEIYDPGAGTWREVGPMPEKIFRHTLTLLNDCTGFLVGGQNNDEENFVLASTALYLPDTPKVDLEMCVPVKAKNGNIAMICL